jgi:hypothetical protein
VQSCSRSSVQGAGTPHLAGAYLAFAERLTGRNGLAYSVTKNMISPRSLLYSRKPAPEPLFPPSRKPRETSYFEPRTSYDFDTDLEAAELHASAERRQSEPPVMAIGTKRDATSRRVSPAPSQPKVTADLTRPTSSSSPVQIPVKGKSRDAANQSKSHHKYHGDRKSHSASPRRPKDVHSPDAIPPSVAALLAVTHIPIPRPGRPWRQPQSLSDKRMTVESVVESAQEADQAMSLGLVKSPLELLLTSPDELEIDELSVTDSVLGSVISTRTVSASMDSVPSLDDSFTADNYSSDGTRQSSPSRRKSQITRRSPEPLASPPDEEESHPLSPPRRMPVPVEEIDFRVFQNKPPRLEAVSNPQRPLQPLKSAFKSNLTASLRAIRQAARSFSSLNFTSIPPEDFLTRSILTIDPQVPYTDERRPPPLEEEPTAALRRYLNPTTVRLDQPQSNLSPMAAKAPSTVRTFTASIQMQTYKVQRSRSAPPSARAPAPTAASGMAELRIGEALEFPAPGPRQREMRENSDFIRIAVMEMAMRKKGKLDDQRPGRARWALPARKEVSKAYEVGSDGVPSRWVSVSCD